ncbi:MAG TPA: aspartyl/asparaginyl beta-hydroxylase domain-containing protein [Gemmataceae bacterium]|jgi:beta-hydroxylase
MNCHTPAASGSRSLATARRLARRTAKRVVPVAVAAYFIPVAFATYVALGLIDFARNRRRTLAALDRYFAGNGVFTWLLAPFNLLLDLLCLPYRNRGVYALADLPAPYQDEIKALIEAAHRSDLVGKLQAKMGDRRRGMIFFKWYGKNVQTSVDVPEFHQRHKYIRTIGVSIFNTRQSTGKHFGPLRVTLRVLYNVNDIASDNVYIQVGRHVHRWRADKLFIFDDTLQHKSCNESDEVRYCLFVDILRPSLIPGVMSGILTVVRVAVARFNAAFYQHWTFIK